MNKEHAMMARANYMAHLIGDNNAFVVDDRQFIRLFKVEEPPPKTVKLAIARRAQATFGTPAPLRFDEFTAQYKSTMSGWYVYE